MKKIYEESASIIPGWRYKNRSDLCRSYLRVKDTDKQLAESYLSAIICHFWNLIGHNYHSQQGKLATPQDCYEWLVDSITYALDKHVWTNPNSNLYADPDGPEKTINVCVVSSRANYYVAQNRDKRKIAMESLSLDKLCEDNSDAYFLPYFDSPDYTTHVFQKRLQNYFENKQYFKAWCFHAMTVCNFVEQQEVEGKVHTYYNYNALKRFLRQLKEDDIVFFSSYYKLDINKVRKSVEYISKLNYDQMDSQIKSFLLELRRDKELIKFLQES